MATGHLRPTTYTEDQADRDPLHGEAAAHPVRWWMDLVGVVWVLGAALAVLLPTLHHGLFLGSYDWISQYGLSKQSGITVHHPFDGDQITQMIPWTSLAWTQVHHGQLPLWNPYSVSGTPLAFNWQSAAFSLPALVGYLGPLRLAYTVQVFTTFFVAGTGAYVLGRVLRLNVMACALAGVAFELCGSFIGWIGWPVASVVSWSGWILASVILVTRGGHRWRSVLMLSVTLAWAILAGQPDTLVLLVGLVAVFAIVLLLAQFQKARKPSELRRSVVDLAAGAAAGLGMGAPLLLPGLALASGSIRNTGGGTFSAQHAVPIGLTVQQVIPGLDGLPPTFHHVYIGVIVAVLAVVGSVHHWRRSEVKALVAVALVSGMLWLFEPAIELVNAIPGLKSVRLPRSVSFLDFSLAVLAGVGLDALVRYARRRSLRQLAGFGFLAVGIITLILWIAYPYNDEYRAGGLFWTGVGCVAGLVAVGLVTWAVRSGNAGGAVDPRAATTGREPIPMATDELIGVRDVDGPEPRHGPPSRHQRANSARAPARRLRTTAMVAGGLLLVVESVVLVMTGETNFSSISTPLTPTAGVRELQRAVGSATVGFGQPSCFVSDLGIPVNANVLFGVHEFAAYDPMLPSALYTSWTAATGRPAGYPNFSHYCPGFITSAEARTYGVGFVLEPRGTPGPTGAVFDRVIDGESLYRVPAAGLATVSASGAGGARFAAAGRPVAATRPSPRSVRVVTDATRPEVLRLHLSAVPGWLATIDGHPLALEPYATVMLQARVPAGHHVIELSYWPRTFTLGIGLAALSVLGLAGGLVVGTVRRRRAR
jgi:Bacterial membrane protein YfhO